MVSKQLGSGRGLPERSVHAAMLTRRPPIRAQSYHPKQFLHTVNCSSPAPSRFCALTSPVESYALLEHDPSGTTFCDQHSPSSWIRSACSLV